MVARGAHRAAPARHHCQRRGGCAPVCSFDRLFAPGDLDMVVPARPRLLFVYSESPIWRDYLGEHILPLLGERAIVLNWSERKRWRVSLRRLAFYHFGGYRQFNPLAVVFRPFHRTRTFRFWEPFKEFKHGRPASLHALEREFFLASGIRKPESV
jgi:hypothetical protein